MRDRYYSLMPRLLMVIPLTATIFFVASRSALLSYAAAAAAATAKQATSQSTIKTAALESHEGVTISALPWTQASQYKEKFSKKSPFTGGVLAVQVSFRNDSDDSIKVALDHIRLSFNVDADNRQELESLKAEEVADAILHPGAKDPTQRRRLPIPLATTGGGGKSKEFTELQTQAQNAAVPTSVVAAHSTVQGLLYFDLQGQFDLLQTAHLYIPDIAIMGKSQGLSYFEIDLSH